MYKNVRVVFGRVGLGFIGVFAIFIFFRNYETKLLLKGRGGLRRKLVGFLYLRILRKVVLFYRVYSFFFNY